jgi:prepilin-type processing-associated H-X9-DG protein
VDCEHVFPTGTWSKGDWPPEKRFSWLFAMAPYTEANNIYSRAKHELSWDAAENCHLVDEPYRITLCPGQTRTSDTPALSNYIGVAGVGKNAATLPLEDLRAGMLGYDRRVGLADIKDGASNTIMIVETTAELGPWASGGPSTTRGLDPDRQPYFEMEGQFGLKHRTDTIFRTNPVGSNVAFADGRVHWMDASISSRTLEALATIAGGDTPGLDY